MRFFQSPLVALPQVFPVPKNLLKLNEIHPKGGGKLVDGHNIGPDLAAILHVPEPVGLQVGVVLQHLALGITLNPTEKKTP